MASEDQEIIFSGRQTDSRRYDQPLWPFLRSRMETFGSRVALVDPYTEQQISYKDLIPLAEKLARALMKLGLTQGKPLCIVSRNSVEFALLIVATHSLGAFVHTPNPLSVPGELRRQLGLSEARLVVTTPEFIGNVEEAAKGLNVDVILVGPRDGHLNFEDLVTLASDDVILPPPPVDPKTAIASLLFSSGTTGLPKGVEITQRNIVAWIHQFQDYDGSVLTVDDTTLLFLQLFHAFGQVLILSASLASGCRVVIQTKFEIDEFLSLVSKYKVTAIYMVPPVAIAIVNHPNLSSFDLSSVRLMHVGAAPMGKELEMKLNQLLGNNCVVQGYGMTENMSLTLRSRRESRPGSCGRLLPNTQCKIIDPVSGKSLGVDRTGELYVRGPQVMLGYIKDPEATALTIDGDGWMRTGDLARIDSEGFLTIVDRLKELIKYKGEQVPPAMLEDLLLSHPAVSDACVIGKPDPIAGELPFAYVVPVKGAKVSAQDIKDFVAKNVPSYMQLRGGVQFRESIPRNPSGKILRRLLRDELTQQLSKARL
ncbi:4-coumarate--CoA ligase 1-like isoform X2 [Pomacea canaliculata]|nr:4-coumarate--CoA ligase 1-like isoform X2 [Pomacea canaliculata]XP_025095082.1 4-coumarate--CoA ligase 1-like isoform X2 [Pomacea canaliculata]